MARSLSGSLSNSDKEPREDKSLESALLLQSNTTASAGGRIGSNGLLPMA